MLELILGLENISLEGGSQQLVGILDKQQQWPAVVEVMVEGLPQGL